MRRRLRRRLLLGGLGLALGLGLGCALGACKESQDSSQAEVVSPADRAAANRASQQRRVRVWRLSRQLMIATECLWRTRDIRGADRIVRLALSEREEPRNLPRLVAKHQLTECARLSEQKEAPNAQLLVHFIEQARTLEYAAERVAAYLREKDYLEDDFRWLEKQRLDWTSKVEQLRALEDELRESARSAARKLRVDAVDDLSKRNNDASWFEIGLAIVEAEDSLARPSVATAATAETGKNLDEPINRLSVARDQLRVSDDRPDAVRFELLSAVIGALKQVRRLGASAEPDDEALEHALDVYYDQSLELARAVRSSLDR